MNITLKSGAECVTLPPGEYVIGDHSYNIPEDQWQKVLDESGYFGDQCWATFRTHDGRVGHVVAFPTTWGDGTYLDQQGREYGVDAGLIGIIAVEDLDLARIDTELAHQLDFVQSFSCDAEGGTLNFGRVSIDTSGYTGHVGIDTLGYDEDDMFGDD